MRVERDHLKILVICVLNCIQPVLKREKQGQVNNIIPVGDFMAELVSGLVICTKRPSHKIAAAAKFFPKMFCCFHCLESHLLERSPNEEPTC